MSFMPIGASGPEPFKNESGKPPEPRQLRPLLAKDGVNSTIAILKRFHTKEPDAPVFLGDFGVALVEELLAKGKVSDAIAFHRFYLSLGQDAIKTFIAYGDVYLRIGTKRAQANTSNMSGSSTPTMPIAADRLKKLQRAQEEAEDGCRRWISRSAAACCADRRTGRGLAGRSEP